jgi:hypothetical protein
MDRPAAALRQQALATSVGHSDCWLAFAQGRQYVPVILSPNRFYFRLKHLTPRDAGILALGFANCIRHSGETKL